jgi:hypothetical protein
MKTIALELVEAIRKVGGRSDLLGIVGSYGDTQPDVWVLDALRRWNAEHPQAVAGDAAKPEDAYESS